MGTRLWLALVLTSACGRVGFDARGSDAAAAPDDGAPDATPDAPGDAAAPPPALVQQSAVASVVGNVVLSLPAASTAGTLLVATVATNSTAGLTLPAGWQLAQQATTNGACAAVIVYYPANPGGITTVTFMELAGFPAEGVIAEWSGPSVSPLDAVGTASSSTPVSAQPVQTSAATAVVGELAITAYCEDVNNPTYTPGSGWTSLGTFTASSSSPSYESDYQLDVPAAVIGEIATSSVQGKYNAAIATFR